MGKTLTVATKFTAVDKYTKTVMKMQRATSSFGTKAQVAFAKVEMSARRVAMASKNLTSKLFNMKTAMGALAVGLVIKKTFDLAVGVAKVGDEAAKTARRLGLSAEALQEFKFAADRSGISGEATVKSFEKLSKNVGDLKANTGSLYTILNKTNPALLKQLQAAKSNEEAFNLITVAVNKLPTQMEKASLSQAAFGRSGGQMLTLMEDGAKGINKLREEARKYGGVISNEAAANSEKFIDAQTNMNFALKGLKNTIGVGLMPKVQEIMEKITGWVGANRELINTKVTAFATRMGNGLMWLANNIGTIIKFAKIYIGTLITLKAVTMAATIAQWAARAATVGYNIALGISGAMSRSASIAIGANTIALNAYKIATVVATFAQRALNLAMKLNPIGLIIAAIVALIAVIKNWSKIWAWIKKQWEKYWTPIKKGLVVLVKIFKKVSAKVRAIWQKLTGWISKLWNKSWGFVKRQVMLLVKAFVSVRDWINKIWGNLTSWISDKWDKLWGGAVRIFRKFVDFFRNIARKIKEIWQDVITWINKAVITAAKKIFEFQAKFLGDQNAAKMVQMLELKERQASGEKISKEEIVKIFSPEVAQAQAVNSSVSRTNTSNVNLNIKDETGKAELEGDQTPGIKMTKTTG